MIVPDKEALLNAALGYAARGWPVVPNRAKDKKPWLGEWQINASTDPSTITAWWQDRPDSNPGVQLGPRSKIVDVECDTPEAERELGLLLGDDAPVVPTYVGKRGKHRLFLWSAAIPFADKAVFKYRGIEFRTGNGGKGAQSVFPPSVHPDGPVYTWLVHPDDADLVEIPAAVLDRIRREGESDEAVVSDTGGTVFTFAGGDLATDPGAKKGERHKRALDLIGAALGRGEDPNAVAIAAATWAARCTPPMSADEVLKIVSDLAKRERTKAEAKLEEIETEPLPPPASWPMPSRACFHGLAGQFVDLVLPETEADPFALLLQFLIAFGNVVGKGPCFRVGATWHHANLFGVIVGESAKARKGTGGDWVRTLFEFVDPTWATARILDGLSSGEGLIVQVRDPVVRKEPVKERGVVTGYAEVVVDEGEPDKRLLVCESEFVSVLRVAKRDTNTLSAHLRNAWDGKDLRNLTKNSPLKATRPHISMACHITLYELRKALSETENFSGFSNRFLWALSRRSKLLPEGGKMPDLSSIAEPLKRALDFAKRVEVISRTEAARKTWTDIYHEFAGRTYSGALAGVLSRAEAQTLRLSLVFALLDASPTIGPEHCRAAKAVWDFCTESAKIIFNDSTGDPIADRLLDLIRSHPRGISRWELHGKVGHHVKASTLVGTLARLRDLGVVKVVNIETGGRPAETWFPAGARSEETEITEVRQPGAGFTLLSSVTSEPPPDSSRGLTSDTSVTSEPADGMEDLTL